jgi:hypothetical protein
LYLPRLAGSEVLLHAIRDGLDFPTWQSDTFAYAESYDQAAGRYRGLRGGKLVNVSAESDALLVKPEPARHQMDAELPIPADGPPPAPSPDGGLPLPPLVSPSQALKLRRFHGTASLDPARAGRDASRIADEVIAHLAGQVGAEVKVTLEIEASLPTGASDQLIRTVTENSRTLKFTSHGFEKE